MSATGAGLVEDYLDQLYGRLRCAPRDARAILAEADGPPLPDPESSAR
jgi:hypothetical protein